MIVVSNTMVGRYDPVADSWNKFNLPFVLSDFTTAWSGTELVVWGSTSNTGGRYKVQPRHRSVEIDVPARRSSKSGALHEHLDWKQADHLGWVGTRIPCEYRCHVHPQTDSWFPVLPGGIPPPEPRYSASGVWTGSEFIIWGGFTAQSVLLNTGGRFSMATNSWRHLPVPAGLTARVSHTAIWTGSEMLIWGLYESAAQNDPWLGARYNLLVDSWTPMSLTNAPAVRYSHSAIWTGSHGDLGRTWSVLR